MKDLRPHVTNAVLLCLLVFLLPATTARALDVAEPANGTVVDYSPSLMPSYPGDNAFDGNDTVGATPGRWLPLQSAFPNVYVTYHFTNGLRYVIRRYRIMTQHSSMPNRAPDDFTLQGSNNGTDWDVLDTVVDESTGRSTWVADQWRTFDVDTPGSYEYYKLVISQCHGGDTYCGIREIELHPEVDITDATTGHVSGYSGSHASYPGTIAFDDDTGYASANRWLPFQSELPNVYATWQFTNGNRYVIDEYMLIGQDYTPSVRGAKDFKLQGSNDGLGWTDVSSVSNETGWAANEQRCYAVENPGGYARYRLLITAATGSDTYMGLREIELYGSAAIPIIDTLAAVNVNVTTATPRGNLVSTGTAETAVWVYWGLTDGTNNPAAWDTNQVFGVPSATGVLSTNLVELAPSTTYYYRFYATNSAGTVWADTTTTFTTLGLSQPPQIANLAPSNLDTRTATLRGDLTSTGTSETTVWVYFGNEDGEDDPGGWDTNYAFGVQSDGVVTTNLANLALSSIYYYRFFASNSVGTAWASGSERFATPTNFSAWARRMEITFPGYGSAATLVDFPVLIELSENIAGFSYADFASATGGDLRFTLADDISRLNYEIDEWDTNGTSTVWVQIPNLTSNTTIAAFWGRTGQTNAPAYTKDGSTWSRRHVGVWHMKEAGNAPADSALIVGDNRGISNGTAATVVDAIVGKGYDYIDNGRVDMANIGDFIGLPSATLMLWYYKRDQGGGNYGTVFGANNNNWGPRHHITDSMDLRMGDWVASPGTLANGAWHFLAYTFDDASDTVCAYLNGALVDTATTTAGWYDPALTSVHLIGSGDQNGRAIDGVVDEMRASSAARSADWIRAVYMNTASNDVFMAPGPVALGAGWPQISNLSGTGSTSSGVTLRGDLTYTGTTATAVWVYWGDEDGADNPAAWDANQYFGVIDATGVLSTNIAGLDDDTTYYYRFVASNDAGTTWASSTATVATEIDFTKWMKTLAVSFTNYSRATPLTNFPVLVKLSTSIPGFSYNDFQSAQGDDLRFSANDRSTALAYDVEKWDTGGESLVWVRVPVFTNNVMIHAYWGSDDATGTDSSTAGAVAWSDEYLGVYHLHANANDSTVNGNHGMQESGPTNVAAVVGDGFGFSAGARIDLGGSGWDAIDSAHDGTFTLGAWVNPARLDLDQAIFGRFGGGGDEQMLFWLDVGGGLANYVVYDAGGPRTPEGTGIEALQDQWQYVVATSDGSLLRMYVNGVLSGTSGGTVNLNVSAKPLSLGTENGDAVGRALEGALDEARISYACRPLDWIWAEYMNMASNRAFNTYSNAVNNRPVAPEVTTLAATGIAEDGATLHGELMTTGTAETAVWVYWGETDGTNNAAAWHTSEAFGVQTAVGPLSINLTGLTPDTTYYCRFYASNAVGGVWSDTSTNFTTLAMIRPPEIANVAATGITHAAAWLNGNLTSTGTAETTVWVYWGETDGDTNALSWDASAALGAQSSTGVVTMPISGLDAYTTYHYRFYASNTVGGAWAPSTASLGTALDYTAWSRRLRVDLRYDRETPLTNFPVLVKLSTGVTGFSYDDFASATAGDLRVLSSDQRTELNYEIEEWDASGESCLWVQIPELTGNSVIFAYWGNPDDTIAPAYTTNGATWDDSFHGVWHLDEVGVSGDCADSTTNAYDGVNEGTANVDGLISKGQDFERGNRDYIDVPSLLGATLLPDTNTPITLSGWLRAESIGSAWIDNRVVSIHDSTAPSSVLSLGVGRDNRVEVYHDGDLPSDNLPSISTIETGRWYYAATTYDGSIFRLYVDGALDSQEEDSLHAGAAYAVKIGTFQGTGNCFDGVLDELRIDKGARSADWIHASWMNQGSNSVFNGYGSVLSTVGSGLPDITTLAATNILASSVFVNATLVSTGSSATAVSVYWGLTDGGTNASSWGNTTTLPAPQLTGALTTKISGLSKSTLYYYRFHAANASGGRWGNITKQFVTFGAPDVGNDGGATAGLGYAVLNGELTRTNGSPASAFLYWGTSDGNTNALAWENQVALGGLPVGTFAYDTRPLVGSWSGFANQDVGSPLIPGSVTYTSDVWTVTGGGDNAWDLSDNCHFAYRAIAGDFEVYCRVSDFSGGTDDYRKGGIMVRDSLAADSKNAMVLRTPSGGAAQVRFQRRLTDGGTTADSTSGGCTNAYYWLKLKRSGDDFSGYWAEDSGGVPGAWIQLGGTPTIDMSDVAYLGLAVTARNDSESTTQSFDHWTGVGDGDLLYGLQYYYRSAATNSYGTGWAASTTNFLTLAPDWLAITNTTVSGVAGNSADAHATLTGAGAVFDVYAYWGQVDGETNLNTWGHTNFVGSFSNATRDIVSTLTGLAPDTWYYYTFRASNFLTDLWASPSTTFKSVGVPVVSNAAPTGVTIVSATLGGELSDGGSAEARIYWGLTDEGETASAWANTSHLGTVTMGAFSTNVTVRAGGTYYYRCYVTNAVGDDWADATTSFSTPQASISIADASVIEGQSGTASMSFTVSLSAPCASNVTVRYDSADGTATSGSDYTAVGDMLLLTPGQTQAGFSVTVHGDTGQEWPQEYFHVNLSQVKNCTLGDAQAIGTIIEDDVYVEDWLYKLKITFSGYDGSETLTNFPALVELAPGIAAFSYRQFASPYGHDLRFVDATETRILSYEVEEWNTNGSSYIWVQVPEITGTNSFIWAHWGATNDLTSVSAASDIADCVLWLRADAGVQTSGSAVTSWRDQSGQGNHASQTAPGSQPTYVADGLNGKPVIRFDGASSDYMVVADDPSLDNTAGLTIFAVVTPDNLSTAPRGLVSKRVGSDNNQSYSLFFHSGMKLHVDIDGAGDRFASANTFANGSTYITELAYDGTLATTLRNALAIDGTPDTTAAESSASIPDYVSDLTLGVLNAGYGNFLGGDFAEIIIYRRALTRNERKRVGRYLEMKYALGSAYGTDAPSYTTDGSTWSAGYAGVWHLTEGGSHIRRDATANANDSFSLGSDPDVAAGMVAGGNDFDGNDSLLIPDSTTLGDDTTDSMSVSAWLKSDVMLTTSADTYRALEKGDSYFLLQGNNGNLGTGGMNFFAKRGGSVRATSTGVPLNAARWYHITGTFDGTDMRVYQDGVLMDTIPVGGPIDDDNLPLRIGADDAGKYFDGVVDEVRISTVARSADWVRATYLNTSSNGVFGAKSGVIVTHPQTLFITY